VEPQPGASQELARLGAEPVDDPRKVFGEIIFSMLADDDAVREVFLARGLLDAAPAGAVHVNMATISVRLASALVQEHRSRGLGYVAAPVFGRPEAAAAAQLHIVVAGEGVAIDRALPLLQVIGQRIWPVGADPVQANAAKLAGNFMIAAAIESMAEAVVMTERYGVPAAELLNVLTGTLFAAPVFKNYGALIANRKYDPAGFRLVLGLKDVRLALEAAEQARSPMPLRACCATISSRRWLRAMATVTGRRSPRSRGGTRG